MKTEGLDTLLSSKDHSPDYTYRRGLLFLGDPNVKGTLLDLASRGLSTSNPAVDICLALTGERPDDISQTFKDHGLSGWMPAWLQTSFRMQPSSEKAWGQFREFLETVPEDINVSEIGDRLTMVRLNRIELAEDYESKSFLEGICSEMAAAIERDNLDDQRRIVEEARLHRNDGFPEDGFICDLVIASLERRDAQAWQADLAYRGLATTMNREIEHLTEAVRI